MLKYKQLTKRLRHILILKTSSQSRECDVRFMLRLLLRQLRLGSVLLGLETRKSFGLTLKEEPIRQRPPNGVVILLGISRNSYHLLPDLLLFFECMYKISHLCQLNQG